MARPIIICKDCGEKKEHCAFGLCKQCYGIKHNRRYYEENRERENKRSREAYGKDPEKHRARTTARRKRNPENDRRIKLRSLYGITLEEYDELLEAQNNRCAICGITPEEDGRRLSVDHDHETEQIRGLLCRKCNLMLGNARDNIDILLDAINYLRCNDAT